MNLGRYKNLGMTRAQPMSYEEVERKAQMPRREDWQGCRGRRASAKEASAKPRNGRAFDGRRRMWFARRSWRRSGGGGDRAARRARLKKTWEREGERGNPQVEKNKQFLFDKKRSV